MCIRDSVGDGIGVDALQRGMQGRTVDAETPEGQGCGPVRVKSRGVVSFRCFLGWVVVRR